MSLLAPGRRQWLYENSLRLTTFALIASAFVGQVLTGWHDNHADLQQP